MAEILRKKTQNQGLVVVWKMEESLEELFSMLQLSADDLEKVDSYRLDNRKKEFLTSRCLIKQVINEEPIIEYLDSGKPILKNKDYRISISHTKGYVAVAFSVGEYAGIDIEHPSERVARVYKRFVSEKEAEFIPENQKVEYYTLMWSLKESMYKMYDRKNSIFNVNFICHPFNLNKEGNISATFSFEDHKTMDFEYITSDDFFMVYHC
ncbi:4'-phosphopantetheinyl transferase family protein [Labilibacter marinus]|uniref:4'-phosphopantetheinyl transferase family protein n=1 Tax=Labilibacter marinus TaxID=1477105 RepID=UPI000829EFB3|nr:4'-phosphopantetheinyl transferase superfamily protein [Labilibacter marinus]